MQNQIACMPLKVNVPAPKHLDQKLTVCPKCGKECYESGLLRKLKKDYQRIETLCTQCALRKGLDNGIAR